MLPILPPKWTAKSITWMGDKAKFPAFLRRVDVSPKRGNIHGATAAQPIRAMAVWNALNVRYRSVMRAW